MFIILAVYLFGSKVSIIYQTSLKNIPTHNPIFDININHVQVIVQYTIIILIVFKISLNKIVIYRDIIYCNSHFIILIEVVS